MYKIDNGILVKDGKKVFAIGESYYPSFHEGKFPVPPEGDRIGEMKKDLQMMSKMGINHVRFAALGVTKLGENGNIVIDTPFVDAMIKEADKNDISVSVRLQGYSVNLRDFKDVLMINNKGEVQNGHWADFIRNTLHHSGLLEDMELVTKGLAEHFDNYPNVVAYQIYNEPHYPQRGGIFDYHPLAIEAYRKHLVDCGEMTEQEAAAYDPPRFRDEQDPEMWAKWRIFSRDSLTRFLNVGSRAVNAVSDRMTYTCLTTDVGSRSNAVVGVDYYANAREMDLLGYTVYRTCEGDDYYKHEYVSDLVSSASKAVNKQAWCIELDSRTSIPSRIFNKNTYTTIGAGMKGIVYYQWRGDAPSEVTPTPNTCGLLNYDGSKTANFDNAAKMIGLINKLSDLIVDTERVCEGVAVFHSDYSDCYADALCNMSNKDGIGRINVSCQHAYNTYIELRRLGYNVWILDKQSLRENTLGVDTLFIGQKEWLSEDEQQVINEFVEKGGKVYRVSDYDGVGYGFLDYNEKKALYCQHYRVEDAMDIRGMKPLVSSDNSSLVCQLLEGDGYHLLSIVNIAYPARSICGKITCSFDITEAIAYSVESGEQKLEVQNNVIEINELSEGCIILIK